MEVYRQPEYQQQQVPQEQYGYNLPAQPFPEAISNPADLVGKITPTKVAEAIEHMLRGEVIDFENQTWKKQKGAEPYLNEKGIWRIMSIVTSLVNDNTIYSYLDEKEIEKKMMTLSAELITLLKSQYQEFEISKSDMTTIKNIVMNCVHMALKRGLKGGERNFINKSISEIINTHVGTRESREPKRSWMPKLWGK